jgi:hypothetical protein
VGMVVAGGLREGNGGGASLSVLIPNSSTNLKLQSGVTHLD